MKFSEMTCKAACYSFYLKDGEEKEIPALSISGKPIKKSACIFARTGKFPNYNPVVAFDEALDQMQNWIGNCIMWGSWTSDGMQVSKAYQKNKRSKYEELSVGDVFFEFALDLVKNGNPVKRYKFIFTKA